MEGRLCLIMQVHSSKVKLEVGVELKRFQFISLEWSDLHEERLILNRSWWLLKPWCMDAILTHELPILYKALKRCKLLPLTYILIRIYQTRNLRMYETYLENDIKSFSWKDITYQMWIYFHLKLNKDKSKTIGKWDSKH